MFNFSDHLQELRSLIIGVVLLLATTIIGLVWISIGICHGISNYLGAVWGPIVLGLAFFLPMIVFAFIRAFSRNNQPAAEASRIRPEEVSALNIAKLVESLSGHSPFLVTSVAIVAGVLAVRFPALLAVFMQGLSAYVEDAKSRAMKDAS